MSCVTVGNKKLGGVTLPPNTHGHSGRMSVKITNQHTLQHLVYVTLLVALATPHTVWAQAKAAPPISGVIGKPQSFMGSMVHDEGAPKDSLSETSAAWSNGTLPE
jgi:hypothetical protein